MGVPRIHEIADEKQVTKQELAKAISHSINYNGIDAKARMPDWQIADRLMPEIWKHLFGETDVQIFEKHEAASRREQGKT